MEKIPTADEIIEKHYKEDKDEDGNKILYLWSIKNAMIEFAKLHVKAALEAAAEKAECEDEGTFGRDGEVHEYYVVNKQSILTAYTDENIK